MHVRKLAHTFITRRSLLHNRINGNLMAATFNCVITRCSVMEDILLIMIGSISAVAIVLGMLLTIKIINNTWKP